MKSPFHQLHRFLIISMTIIAVSACTDDSNDFSGDVNLIEATASSTSAISLTNYAVSAPTMRDQKNQKGLAGFTQLWSGSASDAKNVALAAASQPAVSEPKDTHEYAQLQIAMRANDFERARKIATTSVMKAMVDQAYQMHQEMLSTELITARADQEIGAARER